MLGDFCAIILITHFYVVFTKDIRCRMVLGLNNKLRIHWCACRAMLQALPPRITNKEAIYIKKRHFNGVILLKEKLFFIKIIYRVVHPTVACERFLISYNK